MPRPTTRRTALLGAGAVLGGAALAACGAGSAAPAGGQTAPSKVSGNVRFATWATGAQGEMKQMQLDAFNQSQSGVKATLESYATSGDSWTRSRKVNASPAKYTPAGATNPKPTGTTPNDAMAQLAAKMVAT